MNGRFEIHKMRMRLDATFRRLDALPPDPEILSDYAKYLCVLVSGFLEQSLFEIIVEYARRSGSPGLQRYVEAQMRRVTNVKTQRILDIVGGFDDEWRKDLTAYLVDERKAAVDSVIDLRNTIAHGRQVGLTPSQIKRYYRQVIDVVEHLRELCIPL